MRLNVNTDELVKHTNRLERINERAMPNAVRHTLNSLAINHKKSTMPKAAERYFTIRQSNFFKANSRVEFAKRGTIDSMESIMGMKTMKKKGTNDYAVQDLDQQEFGGRIPKKSFIPIGKARTRSGKGNIRSNARLSNIKNLVDARKAKGKNDKEKFVKSVIHAGAGGFVLSKFKGRQYVWKINSFRRVDGKWKFKIDPIYTYKEGRSVKVSATKFIERSSAVTMKKVNETFIKEAEKEINRIR